MIQIKVVRKCKCGAECALDEILKQKGETCPEMKLVFFNCQSCHTTFCFRERFVINYLLGNAWADDLEEHELCLR